MDKKPTHYIIIEEMDDKTLREFVNEFFIKRFGRESLKDTEYFEKWFQRFRKCEHLAYLDSTSRVIFFELIKKYENKKK